MIFPTNKIAMTYTLFHANGPSSNGTEGSVANWEIRASTSQFPTRCT